MIGRVSCGLGAAIGALAIGLALLSYGGLFVGAASLIFMAALAYGAHYEGRRSRGQHSRR